MKRLHELIEILNSYYCNTFFVFTLLFLNYYFLISIAHKMICNVPQFSCKQRKVFVLIHNKHIIITFLSVLLPFFLKRRYFLCSSVYLWFLFKKYDYFHNFKESNRHRDDRIPIKLIVSRYHNNHDGRKIRPRVNCSEGVTAFGYVVVDSCNESSYKSRIPIYLCAGEIIARRRTVRFIGDVVNHRSYRVHGYNSAG